ncbi:hypothetical protein ACFXPN_29640 [Streptomyces griseorubiginosus]|uniref:hypothetical protein n=1 Tax=Streptomyces griseorubiginosus TaxID=67304 RepID=UPI00369972AC
MNRTQPPRQDCTPIDIITNALDDHWLTTPPGEPIYHVQAAAHVLNHLEDHGYTIRPTPRPRHHAQAALDLALAAACTAAALASLALHQWIWATLAAIGTALFLHEAHQQHRTHTTTESRP